MACGVYNLYVREYVLRVFSEYMHVYATRETISTSITCVHEYVRV